MRRRVLGLDRVGVEVAPMFLRHELDHPPDASDGLGGERGFVLAAGLRETRRAGKGQQVTHDGEVWRLDESRRGC